ncbi:MAG: TonB family protein [Bacteroidota bacterium]
MESKNKKGSIMEMLFEKRNKTYGAYALRKNYDDRMLIGLLCALSFILMAAGAPYLLKNFMTTDLNKDIFTERVLEITNYVDEIPKKKIEEQKIEKPQTAKSQKGNPPDKNYVASDKDSAKIDTIKLLAHNPNIGRPDGKDTLVKGPVDTKGNGTITIVKPKEPIMVPDKNPEFPGGLEALMAFLKKNIKYPQRAVEESLTGTVHVSFVVDENGKIKDVKCLNALGLGCDQEAMRVIKMMPDWTPGVYQGENVPVMYKVPVRFKIK